MNFRDKSQVKIEVIYKLQSSEQHVNNPEDKIQFHFNEATDCHSITAINQKRDFHLKLGAYKVLTENQTNKSFNDTITDAGGEVINPLLKGFNVALISYGLKGRGKSQLLFGPETSSHDPQGHQNVLTAIYSEITKHITPIGVSLNLLEISYGEEDNSEIITDLLDISGTKDTSSQTLDFQGFTNVVVRSAKELQHLISVAQKRSKNWENPDNSKASKNRAPIHNKAYFLCRMNFVNIREKKQFSFYLVDLIGFDKDEKESVEQVTLNQINKFLDDLILMKDRIESYRETKLKAKKLINTKVGGYSTVGSSHQSKIVGFITNMILSSQTFFVVPIQKQESYSEILPIIERTSKLNLIRYSVEKEYVDASRKIDIMSYQSFIKLAGSTNESVVNATLNLSSTTPTPHNGVATPAHFISGQISPIPNRVFPDRTTKNIQKIGTQDLFEINEVQDIITDNIQTATFPKVPQTFGEMTSYYEKKVEQNVAKEPEEDRRTSIEIHADVKPSQLPKQISQTSFSPQKTHFEDPNEYAEDSESSVLNKETYYIEYKTRAKEVMKIMDEFLSKQTNLSQRIGLPGEHHVLRKNFDLLYGLFIEGETAKDFLMNEFLELGKSLNDLKQDYDSRLEEIETQTQNIHKKMNIAENEGDPQNLLKTYEDEIERLIERNNTLKIENIHLMSEVVKFCFPDSRIGVTKEYEILVKKHTHLIKQFSTVMKQISEREQELNSLKRKDRIFVAEKKKIEAAQAKANTMAAELEEKEEIGRSLATQIKLLERENKLLQEQTHDREQELRKLNTGYGKAAEEASLFQEMANAPSSTFIQTFKQANQASTSIKGKGYSSSKNIKELDTLVNKLRSLNS